MIITLTGADFSASNIGILTAWRVRTDLGEGATYDGPTSVEKGMPLNATVTVDSSYTVGEVNVTMAGVAVSNGYISEGNVITINIAEVTGNVVIEVATSISSSGGNGEGEGGDTGTEGGDSGAEADGVVFDFDFTTNGIEDYALSDIFTVPEGTDTSTIEYDATYGMSLNGQLVNGLNLVTPIDASKAWTLEFTALFVTPTVLAGNRRAFLGGENLYPFVFINGGTYDKMGFQISNGSHKTVYGIMAYDAESSYKIVHDGSSGVKVYVNGKEVGSVSVDFTDQFFTVILGNVKGKSSAYVWQNVETNKSYLHKFKFYYN